jgi:tagatose 6-phosphate kinase
VLDKAHGLDTVRADALRALDHMIVTVTLNLALDVTYEVEVVEWHAANRVSAVAQRAGGKGVNVARVLRAIGHDVVVTGLVGGPTGEVVRGDLALAELADALVPVAGETRRTLAVVDGAQGDATGFWEAGPVIGSIEWTRFIETYRSLLAEAEVVVLSGSLPPGLPADAYAVLCRLAAEAGVPAMLDADGEELRLGLAGRPALVKPNRDELARVTAEPDPVDAAEALRAGGANAVVVSLGAEGLLAVAAEGRWRVAPAVRVAGNPTGAGDAAVAALAAGLVHGRSWPERLADAAALSAAAVGAPLAGSFDEQTYRSQLGAVRVEAVTGSPSPT